MEKNKLDMQSPDGVSLNIEKIAALFPNCVTETAEGKRIDFDQLKQELNSDIIEGVKERYRLDWPGKREAIVTANLPTTNTLRPVREDSVNFDTTENIYIEGDNLEVLKLLQESYLNKIKMIYIDPPYNTGKDFVYKDNFSMENGKWKMENEQDEEGNRMVVNPETSGRYHSDWLTMMYPRLKLARNLLTDDGVIFISIDDNEVHNLRKICDEIFGEGNFVGNVIIKSNPKGSQSESYLAGLHEYLIVFSRDIMHCDIIGHKLSDNMISEYKYIENDQSYRLLGLRQRGGFWRRSERPNLFFKIYINPKTGDVSTQGDSIFSEFVIPIQPTTGEEGTWRWSKEKINNSSEELIAKKVKRKDIEEWDIFQKDYLSKGGEKRTKAKSIWDEKQINYQNGTIEIKNLLTSGSFDYPKPVYLLQRCMEMLNFNHNDIILDFFSGSATTAHAVMRLNQEDGGNRKFIMVQLPEATDEKSEAYKAGYKNICEIGKERIRRAGKSLNHDSLDSPDDHDLKKDSNTPNLFSNNQGNQENTSNQGSDNGSDTGFRVYRLDSSNMKDVYYRPQDFQQDQMALFADNVKEDRTAEDLLTQVMLDWGLPLSLPMERKTIAGKEVFAVAGDSLYACFDKDVDETFAKEIAKEKPLRIVFKDSSFKDDTAKENVKQLLKQLSAETEMRVI